MELHGIAVVVTVKIKFYRHS